ncbi:MAG TPA: response regulator [Bacteroidia bacterium]|nr:response regulator [Bacteroidia bacterium]HNU33447.1 response regulator [Bacteroidia bacterium]
MDKTKILVVEDESIVAKDIQSTLIRLGYDVPATASSAQSAYNKLEELKPDLVFLDIKLKGDLDGINIAEHIKKTYSIPVIFLTSFIDKATLDRAKLTEPYGYLVKPFNEKDLQSTIEMALYKFQKDNAMRADNQRYANAMQSVDEAIFITDNECRITFLNPKAESISQYGNESAQGISIFKLIKIENDEYSIVNAESLKRYLTSGEQLSISSCNVTIMRDYSVIKNQVNVSPVIDEKNQTIGNAFVIKPVSVSDNSTTAKPAVPAAPQANPLENQVIQNFVFVKQGNGMLIRIPLENIFWIQAMDNYIVMQTNNDQYVAHSTMKDLEVKLPPEKFVRVHRSYIVSIEKISVMDDSTVVVNEKTIPIGKSYRDAFLAKINTLG